MIWALIGHRSVLRVIHSVSDRARISSVTAVTPPEHHTAPSGPRSGHRSAPLGARHCKGIVMPSWCPTDALLMPAPDSSGAKGVTS